MELTYLDRDQQSSEMFANRDFSLQEMLSELSEHVLERHRESEPFFEVILYYIAEL